MNRSAAYYAVLKPERTLANVMTTAAGFLLACAWHIDISLLLATIVGTSLIVASACAVNNVTDRGIDAVMPRTNKRALVVGDVPLRHAVLLAFVLGVLGFGLLVVYVNALTVVVGVVGYIDYVWLYAWSKRHTAYSTLIGTLSGSAPIVAGYTAVTGKFDMTALLLGLVMVFWQMAHFYAIGIFRRKDYAAAHIPVWPVRYGVASTRRWIIAYVGLYCLLVTVLAFSTVGSIAFALLAGAPAIYWLWVGFVTHGSGEPEAWARRMFGVSLVVLLFLSGAVSLTTIAS